MSEIEAWISQLQRSESDEARADAAEELGEYGGSAAIAALTAALADPSNAVKVSGRRRGHWERSATGRRMTL